MVHLATSGDVFQVSLLDGRCAGIRWAKMPTRIPLKSYSAQNSLAAKNHLAPKVSSDQAEKPWPSEMGGFSKDSSTCKMLRTMALMKRF